MPDVNTIVLEEATSQALISLDDAKILLGIPASDTSMDAQLQMLIDQNSAAIATLCERIFGKEKVEETFSCVAPVCCPDGTCRVFLTRIPVKLADIEQVESPAGTVISPSRYRLNEKRGKLTLLDGCASEIIVTYSGGYVLPGEAPKDLQQAIGLLVRQSRTEAAREATTGSGIRLLAHKESRVMYFSPKDMAGGGTTTTGGATASAASVAVSRLLAHYQRIEI